MYDLRPYQREINGKVRSFAAKGMKRILVSAPTGAGKTIMSYDIISGALSKGKRVLFTTHRITLAEQSAEKFKSLDPGYVQGDMKEVHKMLIVGTLQTLSLVKIPTPDVIIIDEVHYGYESNMIQGLIEKFPNAVVIGLSATPVDDDGYLLDGFEAIVDDYQMVDLINMGMLTPIQVFAEPLINKAELTASGSDYDEKSLEKVINKEDINRSVVKGYLSHSKGRKFICFGVNKAHLNQLNEAFFWEGIVTAVITADTKKKERDRILEQFRLGNINGLLSIEILTAGFDEPTVDCVIMATATKSWRKFIQCVGRGIRLIGNSIEESTANGKKDCHLLDFGGNIEEHGLPTDRKSFIFKKKISRIIDRELNMDTSLEARNIEITKERQVFLKKIGSLLDLYEGKVYKKESDLQDDVNRFLDKTNYFYWRQNSGKMYIDGRWVHFASKSGLPDTTVFYNQTSFFFGLELKLPTGRLTDHQKVTLPEMTQRRVLFFICESVLDVFKAIQHIESHVVIDGNCITVMNSIYELPERQVELRNKLKIPTYERKQG